MGQLQQLGAGEGGAGGADVRCAICGSPAAGPCARCRRPVCGDCCVLTEGGVKVWALCTGCQRRGGSSLRRPWLRVLGWVLGPVLALAGLVALIALLRRL
ncbi:MAG: hypothetical protein IT370_27600 [Deltaproteobacteria bacterium]|nr:hypothetical protein [Deltaproteobacteria bacterium]